MIKLRLASQNIAERHRRHSSDGYSGTSPLAQTVNFGIDITRMIATPGMTGSDNVSGYQRSRQVLQGGKAGFLAFGCRGSGTGKDRYAITANSADSPRIADTPCPVFFTVPTSRAITRGGM
ncbi:MAG: hypothetical protein ACYDB8_08975 [Acidiferrobacterales bacterium]